VIAWWRWIWVACARLTGIELRKCGEDIPEYALENKTSINCGSAATISR